MPQQPPVVKLPEGLVALALPFTLYLKDLGRQLAKGRQRHCYSGSPNRLRSFWTDHLSQEVGHFSSATSSTDWDDPMHVSQGSTYRDEPLQTLGLMSSRYKPKEPFETVLTM